MSRTRWISLLAVIAVLSTAAVALIAAVSASGGTTGKRDRVIQLSAVEWKGSAEVAKEPFPTSVLPEGGGYERFAPDATGKWSIETYRFDSAVVMACAGERVILKVFGVNSSHHDISIPDFDRSFRVNRGELATSVFRVKKPGIYPIICLTHQPSHRADLVVLPAQNCA